MRKIYLILILTCIFSCLFASESYKQDCKVTFVKDTANKIGYSSTAVSFNNLTPTEIKEAYFNIGSDSKYREASFYIYWKVYEPDSFTIRMTAIEGALTPINKAAGKTIDFYSVEKFEDVNSQEGDAHKIFATSSNSHMDFPTDTISDDVVIYEEGTASTPRVNSKLITLRISNAEVQNMQIDSTTPRFFTTIQVTLTTIT